MTDEVAELIRERQVTHGDAYQVTSVMLDCLAFRGYALNVLKAGISWIMILNKLARLLFSDHEDHWRDIEGWARLARVRRKDVSMDG